MGIAMIEISSKTNDHFKRWMDLNSSKGIRKHQEFFLMGEKLIREFLKNPNYKIKAEIICEDHTPLVPSHPLAVKFGKVSTFKLSKSLFNEIDFLGTHFNLLVLEYKEPEAINFTQEPKGLEIICPLGDPNNLGALIRSSLAFGTSKFILTSESANPFLPKAVKASAGAVLTAPLYKSSTLIDCIETADKNSLYALDMDGIDIQKFEWPKNLRLLVGEEGPGVHGLKVKYKLKIATGPVESLNATVAASIAMYSYSTHKN